MKENVTVHVRGVQRCAGEEEVTELCASGTLKRTADGWIASYEEPQPDGRVRALLRWDGARVSLTRRGAVRSEMVFAAGERHNAFYELSVGSLTMELFTRSLRVRTDGAALLLELEYELAMGGEALSENRLSVRMESCGTDGEQKM